MSDTTIQMPADLIHKHTPAQYFTIIDNRLGDDSKLSFKAFGMLCYLLMRPTNWRVNIAHLAKTHTDGRHAVESAIRELIDAGYMQHIHVQTQQGVMNGSAYLVSGHPDGCAGAGGFPPLRENPESADNPHGREGEFPDSRNLPTRGKPATTKKEQSTKTEEAQRGTPSSSPTAAERREQAAERILEVYADKIMRKSVDHSRSRAKKHLIKLLQRSGLDESTLTRCVERYALWCQRRQREEGYRKASGNYFGRDATWEDFAADDWEPPPKATADGEPERPTIPTV